MNGARSKLAPRGLLLCACLTATACTTLSPALPRPSPAPAPAGIPAPATLPAPTGVPQPPPPAPTGVVPQRTAPAAPTAARAQTDARSASDALLAQSRDERAAGSYAAATASIERALRLDPNNAELWVERGELALQTGNTTQAATMARKALTLTGANRTLTARAERLLRAAGPP